MNIHTKEGALDGVEGNDNLLKRLKTFLPQIATANEELQQKLNSSEDVQKSLQIDASLANDETCESNDEEEEQQDDIENDGSADDENDGDGGKKKKIIQMTVALGNFEESDPVMSLLGNVDDCKEDSSPDHDDSSSGSASDSKSLAGNGASTKNQETSQDLFTIRSSRRKG